MMCSAAIEQWPLLKYELQVSSRTCQMWPQAYLTLNNTHIVSDELRHCGSGSVYIAAQKESERFHRHAYSSWSG